MRPSVACYGAKTTIANRISVGAACLAVVSLEFCSAAEVTHGQHCRVLIHIDPPHRVTIRTSTNYRHTWQRRHSIESMQLFMHSWQQWARPVTSPSSAGNALFEDADT